MIWSLDFDDFNGAFCGQGKYPLLTTVKKTLDRLQGPTTPHRIHKTTPTTLTNHGHFYSCTFFLLSMTSDFSGNIYFLFYLTECFVRFFFFFLGKFLHVLFRISLEKECLSFRSIHLFRYSQFRQLLRN